jgi:hypothetical protein
MGPLYEVYISQMIRYFRACGSYQDFLDRGLLLTRKLLNHDLVDRFGISVSQMTTADNTMAKRKSTKGQTTIGKTYI